jgi:hypothetical protein
MNRSILALALLFLPTALPLVAASGLDIAASAIYEPKNVSVGQTISGAWVDVQWSGASQQTHVVAEFKLDGVPLGRDEGWIGSAGLYSFICPDFRVDTSGGHEFSAVVSLPDDAEADTSNNARSVMFYAGDSPYLDLEVSDLTGPTYVAVDDPFEATARVALHGYAGVPAQVFGAFLVDGVATSSIVFEFQGNDSYVVSHSIAFPSGGWHTYAFVIDGADRVVETNEGNNVAERSVYVEPARPDLAVRIVQIQHADLVTDAGRVGPNPWGRVITVEACNVGAAQLPWGEVTLTAKGRSTDVSSGSLIYLHTNDLAAGACHTWNVSWLALGVVGDYKLIAEGEAYGEANLANNHAEKADWVGVGGTQAGVVAHL